MSASSLLLNAYTRDEISLGGDEQRLVGLMNRMRLFAPPDVVGGAEVVLRAILEILLKPSIELRQLAKEALSKASILIRCWHSARFAGLTWTTCTEQSCKRPGHHAVPEAIAALDPRDDVNGQLILPVDPPRLRP
jgi:hypothetical protein